VLHPALLFIAVVLALIEVHAQLEHAFVINPEPEDLILLLLGHLLVTQLERARASDAAEARLLSLFGVEAEI
jgi:hypothetical protein